MKRIIGSLSVFVALLALSGCAPDTLNVKEEPIKIDYAKAADPAPVQMSNVTFRVINKDNVDAFLAEMAKKQNASPVFIAISVEDYENLSLNLADLRRYIQQQKSVIIYYRSLLANDSSQ